MVASRRGRPVYRDHDRARCLPPCSGNARGRPTRPRSPAMAGTLSWAKVEALASGDLVNPETPAVPGLPMYYTGVYIDTI